jgi:DNA repair exonuclease SbcCD ATPase subunit
MDFQGFGEAQIGELLNQKIAELRKQEELEELRSETEQLSQENEALRRQLDALEETVEAKKKVEYYANILGLAFPGLAKMLSTTPLGGTLGALAGLDTPDSPSSETEKSQRETIIELVSEFMASLDDQALGQLYLVFIELSNNPALIGTLLAKIHEPTDTTSAQ